MMLLVFSQNSELCLTSFPVPESQAAYTDAQQVLLGVKGDE